MTPFGAFLDSVIDRYSDLVVLLGIVVLFARTPNARGALVAMAGLVGSVMVSYTKARAESIGVECNVGFMERPERMICLIAGAVLDVLEPALWVLAVLANLTALQRIVFTRRIMREPSGAARRPPRCALLAGDPPAPPSRRRPPSRARRSARGPGRSPPTSRATRSRSSTELGEPALRSPIGDYLRLTRGRRAGPARGLDGRPGDGGRRRRPARATAGSRRGRS